MAVYCWHLKNKQNGKYFAMLIGDVESVDDAMAFPAPDHPTAVKIMRNFPGLYVPEKYNLDTGEIVNEHFTAN